MISKGGLPRCVTVPISWNLILSSSFLQLQTFYWISPHFFSKNFTNWKLRCDLATIYLSKLLWFPLLCGLREICKWFGSQTEFVDWIITLVRSLTTVSTHSRTIFTCISEIYFDEIISQFRSLFNADYVETIYILLWNVSWSFSH